MVFLNTTENPTFENFLFYTIKLMNSLLLYTIEWNTSLIYISDVFLYTMSLSIIYTSESPRLDHRYYWYAINTVFLLPVPLFDTERRLSMHAINSECEKDEDNNTNQAKETSKRMKMKSMQNEVMILLWNTNDEGKILGHTHSHGYKYTSMCYSSLSSFLF